MIEVECFYRDVPLSVRRLRGRPGDDARYWIGSERDAAAPAPIDHLLVETYRNEILIHAAEGMTGEVRGVEQRLLLATWVEECGSTFALPEDAVVELRLGPMTFVVSRGKPAVAVGRGPLGGRWSEQKYLVGTALVLGLSLLAAPFIAPAARTLSFDRLERDARFLQTRIIPPVVSRAALVGKPAPSFQGILNDLDDARVRRHTGPLSLLFQDGPLESHVVKSVLEQPPAGASCGLGQ